MKRHLLVSVLSLGFLSPLAQARKEKGKERDHQAVFQQLSLTAEQQGKLKSLHQGQHEKMQKLRSEKKTQREAFKKVLQSEASSDAVRVAYRKMKEARAALTEARFEHMLAIREILTPEQRKRFHEAKGGFGWKQGRHGKKRHGHGENDSVDGDEEEDGDEDED